MSANKSKRWEGINRRGNKLWWNYRLPDGERVFEPSEPRPGQGGSRPRGARAGAGQAAEGRCPMRLSLQRLLVRHRYLGRSPAGAHLIELKFTPLLRAWLWLSRRRAC